ncbi:carbohydrate sulfotransferase 3-like [Penaeus japonicus]|uniref:carbohydrate sulfotransferase 3-like n=1 Tax=Penaeus japonicus TaxID=27405 RepID=UPI001C713AE5|nr:carbohydrate sulfotransferase 3-like [Penaeus japonicus]
MGKVLARASPATFYSYEPLHMYGVRILDQDSEDLRYALVLMKDLMRCRLQKHPDQVSHMGRQDFYFQQNTFLNNLCRRDNGMYSCKNATYVGEVCGSAELHVVKVLRLSLKWVRPLLENSDLDFQVIYLARDPRAVLSSRVKEDWCTPSCQNPERMCSLLAEDLREAVLLEKEYPSRFKFIKYDEVCDNPLASLKTVMSFLNLPVTKPQEVILPSRKIGQNDKEIFSRADLWRRRSSFTQIVKPVQNYCRSSLEKLGLRIFVSEQDLHDLSIPTLSGPSGL